MLSRARAEENDSKAISIVTWLKSRKTNKIGHMNMNQRQLIVVNRIFRLQGISHGPTDILRIVGSSVWRTATYYSKNRTQSGVWVDHHPKFEIKQRPENNRNSIYNGLRHTTNHHIVWMFTGLRKCLKVGRVQVFTGCMVSTLIRHAELKAVVIGGRVCDIAGVPPNIYQVVYIHRVYKWYIRYVCSIYGGPPARKNSQKWRPPTTMLKTGRKNRP